ncbi:unnamed protein product [Gongylonema pulchrum]|uniref:Transposase n=1 Tax=Gongylonema pulchrum TaxID=637853 RepID=A0A183ESK6_9BILA|nr:unnamed protein product [Gongylonema pulchrum]
MKSLSRNFYVSCANTWNLTPTVLQLGKRYISVKIDVNIAHKRKKARPKGPLRFGKRGAGGLTLPQDWAAYLLRSYPQSNTGRGWNYVD